MDKQRITRYADIFAALGSESRLEIVSLLLGTYPEGMTVGEIQEKLQIPNSTLSHHLEKLRLEGLVTRNKEKQWLRYTAKAKTIEELLAFLYNGCSTKEEKNVVKTTELRRRKKMFAEFFRSIFEGIFEVGTSWREMLKKIPLSKYTPAALGAIELAKQESKRQKHRHVGTEQILLGIIQQEEERGSKLLKDRGIEYDRAKIEIEKIIGFGSGNPEYILFTPRAKNALEVAFNAADKLGEKNIGTEHLLLGIIESGEGVAMRVLKILGVDLNNLEKQLRYSVIDESSSEL